MKALVLCAGIIVAVASFGLLLAADAPAGKQFMAKIVITEMKNGKQTIVAQPTLVTLEKQEGSFLAGGEVPVDPDTNETMTFGLRARVKVRQLASDKLRVTLYVGQSDLDSQDKSEIVIREAGAHCVKTVKPGEEIAINLGSNRKATVTINPMQAKN